ncbi:MAG: SMC-Scp complex subunit ScpB [Akkermansiaceae bacterium]|nr:SMC-Scp complex subunit ScpB [Akkermansiaceae bacterium]
MQLSAIIEALLTASQEPVPTAEIARLVRSRVAEAEDVNLRKREEGQDTDAMPEWMAALADTSEEQVVAAIGELNATYEESGRAFSLVERAKGWKLYTKPEYGEFVGQLFPGRKPERLSGPAMETLAIIAYRQPITKAAVEAVRGVSCDGMIQKLLDRDLIRIGGRAELPGRPLLYETTDLFFEHFGIRSIDDLPNATELRKVELPQAEEQPAPEEKQLSLAEAKSGEAKDGEKAGEGVEEAKTEAKTEGEA